MWANLEGWVSLYQKSRRVKPLLLKLYAWIAPPEWEPGAIHAPETAGELPAQVSQYATIQFTLILVLTLGFFLIAERLTTAQEGLASAWIVLSLGSLGAVLNEASWAQTTELIRRVALLPLIYFLLTK